jgi:hypothetical protein
MSDGLADLLRKKKQLQEEQKVKIKIKKCSVEIKSFYDCLEDWLSDLIEEKIVLVSYENNECKLKAGKDEIKFIPKRRIVGTTGMIEMKTKNMKLSLIRDRDGIWKQLISRSPFNIRILTKRYFRGLLKNIYEE